jgi:hypothetical protein
MLHLPDHLNPFFMFGLHQVPSVSNDGRFEKPSDNLSRAFCRSASDGLLYMVNIRLNLFKGTCIKKYDLYMSNENY